MFKSPMKWFVVLLIIVVAVFADQLTKIWAEENFASPRYPDHAVALIIPDGAPTTVLSNALAEALPDMKSEERAQLAAAYVSRNGVRLNPTSEVQAGDVLALGYVSRTVIDGYWDYQYARNPGAAWSFLADANPTFRTWFFGVMGILALILLSIFIYMYSWKDHRRIVIVLAIIMGGAIGNILDRFRLGYVIDFISWHVGDKYWPTFNIADAFVTCGVALMILDLLITSFNERKEKKKQKEAAST
ncbi:MAG: signal peptidase II [Bradymonadales bacterium]|jgi:signal peptidase II